MLQLPRHVRWYTSRLKHTHGWLLQKPLLYYNDAIQNTAHSISSRDPLSDNDMFPKGQYTVITNLYASTKIHTSCFFTVCFWQLPSAPSANQSFYLTTASCMAKGRSTPTHTRTHTFTAINTFISPALQRQTPLLFDLSHPSPCLIPASPLASTKWNANSPA